MKTLKLKTTVVLSFILLTTTGAYLETDTTLVPSAGIISSVLNKNTSVISTNIIGNDYSVGYVFKPEVNGAITQVGIHFPEAGSYTVSIWEVETFTLLTQVTITQADEEWSMKEIPDLLLSSEKSYAVCSFLPIGVKYYSASNVHLPLDLKSVKVLNSVAAYGNNYPVDLIMTSGVFGFVDFTFEANSE